MVDKECLLNILINLVAFFRIACKNIGGNTKSKTDILQRIDV